MNGQEAADAADGRHGFPVRPGDKRPAVDRWEQRACADPVRIARYWPSPAHNLGIACGPSGLVVVDLDNHTALPDDWARLPGVRDGRDVLAQLCEWAGADWPSTYTVSTPSGGWHLYFTAPEGSTIRNSAGQLGPLVDVRAAGGYVVGAGSVIGGRAYEVVDSGPAQPLPAWIGQALGRRRDRPAGGSAPGDPAARLRGILRAVASAPEGERNQTLHWAACRAAEMVSAGCADPVTVTEALALAATAAGLPEREARRTIGSGLRGGER